MSLFVCLFACVLACLLACLFACLFVCLFVCVCLQVPLASPGNLLNAAGFGIIQKCQMVPFHYVLWVSR